MARQHESVEEAPASPSLSADQFQQLLAAVLTSKQPSLDADTLKTILESQASVTAKAVERAANPSNPSHPGKSVFSHPLGDREMPKPDLPYDLSWNGYPVNKFPETETWSEWMAQSNIPGKGEYTVLRLDGSKMKVTVETETDADGKTTRVKVMHPVMRADRDKIPAKTVIIAQMQNKDNPRTAFLSEMQKHLAEMFQES